MSSEQHSEEERNEIIKYGIERGKVILISTVVALTLGCVTGVLFQSIVFLAAFCLLRRYAGGYHADTQERCYVISFATVAITFWLMKRVQYNITADILMNIFCLLSILFLAPVENSNRRLEEEERKKYGRKTKVIAITISLLNTFFRWKGYHNIVISILAAYLVVTISLVLGCIKLMWENKKANGQKGSERVRL